MSPQSDDARTQVLAIDGPGGAGKSTVTRLLSERLGLGRLDTGAVYRAVTAAVLAAKVDPADAEACTRIARSVEVTLSADRVAVDGRDVTEEIRGPAVTAAVSVVSAHAGVRRALVEQQRRAADGGTWIVEGRDIGTVVFPDAALKVFLTASAPERARRRAAEVGETDVGRIESEIRRRDLADSTRSESPLRAADDAVTIDTTDLDADEVVARIEAMWRGRCKPTGDRTGP